MCKPIVAMVALGLVASLSPQSASADHCREAVSILSTHEQVASSARPDPREVTCVVDEGHQVESRIIYPGSVGISVRYLWPQSDSYPLALTASLSGSLGIDRDDIHLVRTSSPTPGGLGVYYGSASIWIPRDAQGCVTAAVRVSEDPPLEETTTYRTLGSTC